MKRSINVLEFLGGSFLILSIFFLTISACTPNGYRSETGVDNENPSIGVVSPEVTFETEPVSPVAYSTRSSSVTYRSIPELSYHSDIVVIARILAEEELINTARDPLDISQPAQDIFSLSQIYKVKVDRYLKGDGPPTLLLVQNQGMIPLAQNKKAPDPELIERIRELNRGTEYTLLRQNHPYLMFLRVLDKYNYQLGKYNSSDLFTGANAIWLYDLANPPCAQPENVTTSTKFPPRILDELLAEIASPFDPDHPEAYVTTPRSTEACATYPYPAPLESEVTVTSSYP